jgi:hypothetical protein
MRKLFLAWLLVAASIAGCVTYDNRTATPPPPDPFAMVCAELELACDFAPPEIITTKIIQWIGWGGVLGGYVPSEPYIFIDPAGPHMWKTILHEVTHYVAYNAGIEDGSTQESMCESEALARVTASKLTNTEVLSTWRENYGCESP